MDAARWTSESTVADRAAYERTVLAGFRKATLGSFTSDHDKDCETSHGRQTAKVNIAYAIARAEREVGAIVVVNGRSESFSHYAELAYDLNRHGYTLYMIDHRGQGHSTRLVDYQAVGDRDYQKGHVDNFDYYVDDFAKFVDSVVLPDRSMGGAILTEYVEQHTRTFARIALSSPMVQIKASAFALATGTVVSKLVPHAYALGQGPRDLQKDDTYTEGNKFTSSRARFEAKVAVWNGEPFTKIGGATYGWVAEAVKAGTTLLANASQIRTPVLLLQAELDQLAAPEGQVKMCKAINTASTGLCTLDTETLKGSQHEDLIEVDEIRNKVLDRIVSFFQQH
jgi:lysophospholipase